VQVEEVAIFTCTLFGCVNVNMTLSVFLRTGSCLQLRNLKMNGRFVMSISSMSRGKRLNRIRL
jgi:hypothetical protein